MNKKNIFVLGMLVFVITCIAGYMSGIGLQSLVKTVDVLVEPGVGSIQYVHPELAEVANGTSEYLGKRMYDPWEPVVIIEEYGDLILVRFCSDGYESTYNRHWFKSYKLTNQPASYAYCDN